MKVRTIGMSGVAALAVAIAGPAMAWQSEEDEQEAVAEAEAEAAEEAAEAVEEAEEALEEALEETLEAEEEALEAEEEALEEALEAEEEALEAIAEAEEAALEAALEAEEEAALAAAPPEPHTPEGSPHFIPAPPEGKGQVVFYRSSMMGFAMGCTVNQGTKKDKTKITSVGSGKYVIVAADPGKQDYWVKNEKKDAITLLVEEGETQYVRCRIKMGFMSGRPDLTPSSAEEFVEKGGGLKMVDDDDMGEGALRSTDIAALR